MKVFIDTSAFYALISDTDAKHQVAVSIHERLKQDATELLTTNYVLLECVSLLQRRYGFSEAARFGDLVEHEVRVVWLEQAQHQRAWEDWKQRGARSVSLVDCSCFVVMRELAIRQAFAFDEHFRTAGFQLLATPPRPGMAAERRGRYRTTSHAKTD